MRRFLHVANCVPLDRTLPFGDWRRIASSEQAMDVWHSQKGGGFSKSVTAKTFRSAPRRLMATV
jgi:hypothetical protein